MGAIRIENGRVICPASAIDEVATLYVQDGRIAGRGVMPEGFPVDAGVIDATGLVVSPGFVDLHAHLREPGYDHAESIESGGLAAAAGGYTTICCLPDTKPVNDNAAVTRYIIERARAAVVHVRPIGSISKGMAGEDVAAIGSMREAGAVAISDDGAPVMNARLMRRAMELAADFDMPVMTDCEDHNLARGGVMHEGLASLRMGLRGIPALAEDLMTFRDIELARTTGVRLHIAHLSTAKSLDFVRRARQEGIRVSCEVCAHHLALTDEHVQYDGNYKIKPPLRSDSDVAALCSGIQEGVISAIATDHQPHPGSDKMQEFDECPFGILGFETSFALSLETLYHRQMVTLPQLLGLYTSGPADVLGLACGCLRVGDPADIAIIDPNRWWQYDVNQSFSKSRNSPFHGRYFQGRVVTTMVAGNVVWNA
ncbi:MAG: dihydroorotase [Bryobacterales bacterium]|jgi:dihydroorotase|nr:dihydroorotase [Bryobacterales bacterium]